MSGPDIAAEGAAIPERWTIGRFHNIGCAIVSTHDRGHHDDAASLEFYGGHLIAESVPAAVAPVLAASLDMLAALKAVQTVINARVVSAGQTDRAIEMMDAAIARAEAPALVEVAVRHG